MTGRQSGRGSTLVSRVLRPPIKDLRFWFVQAMVVGLAAIHYVADETLAARLHSTPAGVPVVLLVIPVGYAAVRYGLAGSVATAVCATLLWLPDLLLPHDQGHLGNDATELVVVIAVAAFVGYYIDKERRERDQVAQAEHDQQAAEARYRQLFDTNVAPILVLDEDGTVLQANPAASTLGARTLGARQLIGTAAADLLGRDLPALSSTGKDIVTLPDPEGLPRDYRISITPVIPADSPRVQLMLQDITEELAEGQQARNFAELLLQAQEEERQRIARELHDEPLQLLVSLARSLERVGDNAMLPAVLAGDLVNTRDQTLDLAAKIRNVVRGLRPPALAQLGLIAAVRGFLVGITEVSGVRTHLDVFGNGMRMRPEFELGAFRIVQEAVNNAIRHSGADQLRVTIIFAAQELRLRVADDGCGFDPSALTQQPRADRLGLLGMRERANLLGGTLAVRSAPGEGTQVDVTLPVPHDGPSHRALGSPRERQPGTAASRHAGPAPASGRPYPQGSSKSPPATASLPSQEKEQRR